MFFEKKSELDNKIEELKSLQKQWREANASRAPPKKKKVNRAPPPSSPSSSSGSDYSPTPADDDASDQDFIPDSGEEDFTCKKRKEVGPPPLDMLSTAENAIEGAVFEPDLYTTPGHL